MLCVADQGFSSRLRSVTRDDWERPTPCTEWDVRALVNHVIGANVRYRLLLDGATLDAVEATREVDHLGGDAVGAFAASARQLERCAGPACSIQLSPRGR